MKLADKIVMRPIAALIPYASNARTHTPEQIDLIAKSLQEFGWTNPILVDGKNGIVAGHARAQAAKKLGLTEVPTIELSWLTAEQRQAYIITDNQSAIAGAGWDREMLALELGDLKELGFDLALTGFSDIELGSLFADKTDGLTDPDDAPALPEHPVSRTGDLWLLGRHRLLCGDSTVATDVERVLGGVAPHLMVTDPPYGVDYDPKWRMAAGLQRKGQKIADGEIAGDCRANWAEAWCLFPGDVAYTWSSDRQAAGALQGIISAGFEIRAGIVWAKSSITPTRGHYHTGHEPCWYAVRKGRTAHWRGDHKQSTLWQIPSMHRTQGNADDGRTVHASQKPVECMRRPIENNSSSGQAVYEPFCGSGTTIIAAEMTGRSCHAIEIAPTYIDVAVKRWQDFTGEAATLDGDGRTFDQIAAERARVSLEELNSLLDGQAASDDAVDAA